MLSLINGGFHKSSFQKSDIFKDLLYHTLALIKNHAMLRDLLIKSILFEFPDDLNFKKAKNIEKTKKMITPKSFIYSGVKTPVKMSKTSSGESLASNI